jgi:hypothetical protein
MTQRSPTYGGSDRFFAEHLVASVPELAEGGDHHVDPQCRCVTRFSPPPKPTVAHQWRLPEVPAVLDLDAESVTVSEEFKERT